MSMKFSEYIKKTNQDKAQWRKELGKELNFFLLFIFLREYRIVSLFRLCSYLRTHWYFLPLYCFVRIIYRHESLSNGCDIPSHTEIGAGFVIHHCSGIVIHPNAIIGKNCVIRSGCVIGMQDNEVPVIKDNVVFGVHAIVIGKVVVENNCIIGAGSVVTKSTDPNGIYAGVPARRIKNCV